MKEVLECYVNQIKDDTGELLASFRAKSQYLKAKQQKLKLEDLSLIDFLPYESFSMGAGIFENTKTLGFILASSHFTGMDYKGQQSLRSIITNDLPPDVTLQIINYASPRIGDLLDHWKNSGSVSEIFKIISQRRHNLFKEGNWQSILGNKRNWVVRDFELYLCFSMNKPMTPSGQKEAIYKLEVLKDKMIHGLKAIGSDAYALDAKEFVRFLKEIINPSADLYKNRLPHVINSPLRANFESDAVIEMKKDSVWFKNSQDEFHYLVFEVTGYPDVWRIENGIDYIGLFESGYSIPCPFYLSYAFNLKSRGDSERTADNHRVIKTQQANSKLMSFVPKMIEEVEDWRYVSESLSKHSGRLGKGMMYLTLCIRDESKIEECEQVAKDLFSRLGFAIEKVTGDCLNTLLYTLPFGISENWQMINQLKCASTQLSETCMSLMPVFADMQNYSHPLMLLAGRRGQLFYFDNYKTASEANAGFNMVVVGTAGRGKSVFLQEHAIATLRHGGRVVILDDGRSFQNICELLEGNFVDFGGGNFCINPFSLYRNTEGQEDHTEYKEFFEEPFIDLIVSILCIIVNLDKHNQIDPEVGLYKSILVAATQFVMEKKGSKGGFTDIRNELLHNDHFKNEQIYPLAQRIEFILRSYSDDGRYASYFNGTATLNIENDFTVFELSDLEHNQILRDATLMTVVFLVYAKMRDRSRRTVLAIDEFWKLGKHPAMYGPIEGFARRGRKYQLALILASQRMKDFEATESLAGAAALSQAEWRILLSADGEDDAILKSDLGMSPAEIEIVQGLTGVKGAYSEFMIRNKNNTWQLGRLLLDKFSAKLFSTNAVDVAQVRQMKADGMSTIEAIERLAECS